MVSTVRDSIQTRTEWRSDEGGVMMPHTVQAEPSADATATVAVKPKAEPRVQAAPRRALQLPPKYLAYPYTGHGIAPKSEAAASKMDNTAEQEADTLVADSLQAEETDTVVAGEEVYGIIITDPSAAYREEPIGRPAATGWQGDMSWVYLALSILFCIVCMKFKGSSKYMKAIFDDLTDTRLRSNLFDETVRETSLLVLLNFTWVVTAGILLWTLVKVTAAQSLGVPPDNPALGIGLCTGVAAIYLSALMLAYQVVGNVFSDRNHTRLWLKGASASTALESFVLFPVALLVLVYQQWSETLLIVAACAFAIGKIICIYKGFRIFFAEISSWLLFLYYLCSLEIVPLILTYLGAVWICSQPW